MKDIAFLSSLSARESFVECFKRPFSVLVGDMRWAAATNGKMLVAVQSEAELPALPPSTAAAIVDFLSVDPGPAIHDLAALKAFAAQGITPMPAECPTCKNARTVECDECDGDGRVVARCNECDDEHRHDCGDCGGERKVSCPTCSPSARKDMPGMLGGAGVERRLLHAALEHVDAERVAIRPPGTPVVPGGQAQPFIIVGPDWRVVLMPYRVHEPNDYPTYLLLVSE